MACYERESANTFGFVGLRKVKNGTLADLANLDVCPIVLVLGAPSSLILSNITTSQIQLDWTSNSGGEETGFGIERSLSGSGPFLQIDTVASGVTTYTDDDGGGGLNGGTEYFYQVRALGAIPSSYSNIASAITNLNFKTALSFDGVNDNVRWTGLAGNAVPESWSLSFWLNLSAAVGTDNWFYIDANSLSSRTDTNVLVLQTGGTNLHHLSLFVEKSDVFNPIQISNNVDEDVGGWHNFVISRKEDPGDSSKYIISVFRDGIDVSSGANPLKSIFTANYQALTGLNRDDTFSPNCIVDDFMIVNASLDINDSVKSYNSGNGSNWIKDNYTIELENRLNEADEDINGNGGGGDNTGIVAPEIVDGSGNAHDGTMFNFAKTGATSNWVDH